MIEKKRTVKVIKRQEAITREGHAEDESGGSNIWSKSVRLWVDQYRQASAKQPPAFDRLFKDSESVGRPVAVND